MREVLKVKKEDALTDLKLDDLEDYMDELDIEVDELRNTIMKKLSYNNTVLEEEANRVSGEVIVATLHWVAYKKFDNDINLKFIICIITLITFKIPMLRFEC
jgi:hypothetical protein